MGRLYIYLHEWLIFMVNVGKYTTMTWILWEKNQALQDDFLFSGGEDSFLTSTLLKN